LHAQDGGRGDGGEAGAFGEILAHQPVGVLVQAALPRVVWLGEVEIGGEPAGHAGMHGEFLAVVGGDGVHMGAVSAQLGDDGAAGGFGLGGIELVQQSVARNAVHQAEDGAFLAGAHDGVHLPIADADTLVHNGGSLIDVDAARDDAATGNFAATLVVALAGAPQLPEQRAASALVGPDVLVDALVADAGLLRHRQPGADLLRAPFLTPQLGLDQPEHRRRHLVRNAAGRRSAGGRSLLRLLVAVEVLAAVTLQFAADSRLADADPGRHRRLRQPNLMQRRQLTALLQRQMLTHPDPLAGSLDPPPSGRREGYPLCVSKLDPRSKKKALLC